VSGQCNSVTNTASLSLATVPTITTQPTAQSTPMGNGAAFSVVVGAGAAPFYQWQSNGVNIAGATASSVGISNLLLTASGAQIRVVVTNCAGAVTSSVVTLTVTPISAISFDFNTPGQYTNAPYNLIGVDWMNGNLVNQQPFGPVIPFEVSTGGVGTATGGGALDLMFNQGNDNTSWLLPVQYDFSLTGKVLTASIMMKVKMPVAAQRSVEMGFMTTTNPGPNVINPVPGFNGNQGQGFMAVVLNSVTNTAGVANFTLLTQQKATNGATVTTTVPPTGPNLNATNTLATNRWYKLVGTFINTKTNSSGASPGPFTMDATLQDMGTDGITPGTNVLVMIQQTQTNIDIVGATKLFFGIRTLENGGIDYIDNVYVTTTNGPVFFVQAPTNQTVLQGRTATFRALVDGDGPYTYQWYKNGVAIPGAGNWKYTTPQVLTTDNNAQYTVTVTSPNNLISNSVPAVLTVSADTLAVLSVGSVEGSLMGLRFNQPVDKTSAENAANYKINGVTAIAATLRTNNNLQQQRTNATEVLITPSSPVSGVFSAQVTGVTSISGTALGANNTATGVVAALTGYDVNPLSSGQNGQVSTMPGQNYSFASNSFEITGGGHDIFGTFDGFRYVYTQKAGDFDVKVRIPYLDALRQTSKAGIDVRVTLDPASPSVYAGVNPQLPGRNFFEGTARHQFANASVSWGNNTAATYPNTWLRLRRVGNTFLRYSSTNGVNWLFDGQTSPTNVFPSTVYFGFAVCAAVGTGTVQQPETAQFDSYGDFPGYSGPALAITTQPANGTVIAGASTNLTVVATWTGSGLPASVAGEVVYLWQRTNTAVVNGWTNMPTGGATNNILTTGPLQTSDNLAQYRVIVMANGSLSVTSSVATITNIDTNFRRWCRR